MTDSVAANSESSFRFSYTAKGGDYFLLMMKTFFLSLISLGIYWFWGRVQIIKFYYNNTKLQDFSFDYHATGKEKFIGFLKGVGILIIFGLISFVLTWIFTKVFNESIAKIIVGIFTYIVIFSALPFVIVLSLRFRLSRTSFNGIRFQFLGDPKEFLFLFLKSLGLTIITLGFYYPWFLVNVSTYITQNSLYGNHAFDIRLKAEELFIIILKGFLLTFITFGIYVFWFRANMFNFFWNNYYFQNGKTNSNLTGGKLFLTALKSVGLFIITLGIGVPWIIIMNQRVLVESVSFNAPIDFETISQIPIKQGSATLDSIGGDALDSLGSIVG